MPVYEQVRHTMAPHRLRFPTAAQAFATLPKADFIIGDWTGASGIDADALAKATRCLVIFQPSSGFERIDTAAASTFGIPVANAPGENAVAVAEWTVMAILALLKEAWRNHAALDRGEWRMVEAAEQGVYELAGRTVGILGFGHIGQAVARRLQAFDLGALFYADPMPAPPEIEQALAATRLDLDELCTHSEILTVHLPLLPSTRGLLDGRRLALLPSHAIVVNAARGAIVDERDLCAALDGGALKGAALDVFSEEPLAADHPLHGRPNVLLSPHLAGSTNEARRRMIVSALTNLDRVLRGGDPFSVVNAVPGIPRRA
jgi:phosphoglycerate dehydrogenase-like enzyme